MPLLARKITQAKRGPSLKLVLAVTSQNLNYGEKTVISETIEIDGLAKVCFKVSLNNNNKIHKTSISTIKHELANDTSVRMNVTCDALKYSKNWNCSDNWTNWICMGTTAGTGGVKIPNRSSLHIGYLSIIEIRICVYEMNTSTFNFSMLYEDSEWSDFHLSTPEGSVAVHRAVLAAHSDVFKSMLSGKSKETNENLVQLKGFTLRTIRHLKDFLYLGTLPDEGLRELITLGALYSMNHLKKECARKLAETVAAEDLYSLQELACAYNIPELICAITQLTPDEVVNRGHQMNKEAENKKQSEEK